MTKTVHAELTCAAFQYVIRLVHDGAGDEASSLGLTEKGLQWIASLTEADLQRLKEIRFSPVLVAFDDEALDRLRCILEQRKREGEEENGLLRLGAHLAMMRQLCGMGGAEYAKRRRSLGLGEIGVGRPVALNEDQHQLLWQAWRDSAAQNSSKARYIAIGQSTGIALCSVWSWVQQWENASASPETHSDSDGLNERRT